MKKVFMAVLIAATFASCKKDSTGSDNCGTITSSTEVHYSSPDYTGYVDYDLVVTYSDGTTKSVHKTKVAAGQFKQGDKYCQ